MKLSEKRAAAVVTYLKSQGVDGNRMESKGFGLTKPIADNGTPDGREKNRRVEIHIVSRKGG
jgi:OOP family OmpA-OmpF porin